MRAYISAFLRPMIHTSTSGIYDSVLRQYVQLRMKMELYLLSPPLSSVNNKHNTYSWTISTISISIRYPPSRTGSRSDSKKRDAVAYRPRPTCMSLACDSMWPAYIHTYIQTMHCVFNGLYSIEAINAFLPLAYNQGGIHQFLLETVPSLVT